MIPLPNLDDKTFSQLAEEARQFIPVYSPEWTDHNLHDPGITIIELFAWLTEMQRYYLDRVRDENYMKFLKLLGVNRRSFSLPSKTFAVFTRIDNIAGVTSIPVGTRISDGEISFETTEGLNVLNAAIEKLVTSKKNGFINNTSSNSHKGITFYAFGENPEVQDAFYIGFDIRGSSPLSVLQEYSLYIHMFEDYPVPAGSPLDSKGEVITSAKLSWEFFNGDWKKIRVTKDETCSLNRSGRILFKLPSKAVKNKTSFADEKERYWIRCVLRNGTFETAPRLQRVLFDIVPAVQWETTAETVIIPRICSRVSFHNLYTYLSIYGNCLLQVREKNGGWIYWKEVEDFEDSESEDLYFRMDRGSSPKLCFGNGSKGKLPPVGRNNIRLISFEGPLKEFIGSGLPEQAFKLDKTPINRDSFILQVLEDGALIWFDWTMVQDFHGSKPDDRHFVLDSETGEITFGDGKKGLIPPAQSIIRIISCKLGGGEKGNIDAGAINRILSPIHDRELLKVGNIFPAAGGSEPESILDAMIRVRKDMKRTTRAVTCEDYENLALNTPGIRVARAKAISLYAPDTVNYPANTSPASVTVVVVPCSQSKKPTPGNEYLMNVKRYLDAHRLITTEVFVIGPRYVEVSVEARVIFKEGYLPDEKKVRDRLDAFLSPVGNGMDFKGWPFGRTVYMSEIYEVIENIEGVDFVEGVGLSAEGADVLLDGRGNIGMKPNSLAAPGIHTIEAVSVKEV